MGDLTQTDACALVIAHLRAHAGVTAALGGEGRVGLDNEPPYPRLIVTDPPGFDFNLRWRRAPLIQVEAIRDPDGTPGKGVLFNCLYTALQAIAELPDRDYGPDDMVVTDVTGTGGGGWVPLPSGQGRYLATVTLTVHPPHAVSVDQ